MTNKKIAILVDSGCDVPNTLLQANHIYEIPLKIIYETESFTDKVTITAEEIYDRLPNEIPKTSLPEGAIIQKIFKKIIADGYEQLIAITISSGLSGTFNSIRLLCLIQKILGSALEHTQSKQQNSLRKVLVLKRLQKNYQLVQIKARFFLVLLH